MALPLRIREHHLTATTIDPDVYRRELVAIMRDVGRLKQEGVRTTIELFAQLRRDTMATLVDVAEESAPMYRQTIAQIDDAMTSFATRYGLSLADLNEQGFELGGELAIKPLAAGADQLDLLQIGRGLTQNQLEIIQGFSAELVQGVTQDLRKRINGEVAGIFAGTQTPHEAAAKIGRNLTDRNHFSTMMHRARTIVVTEIGRAQALGTQLGQEQLVKTLKDAGDTTKVRKRWLNAHLPGARETHIRAESVYGPDGRQGPIPIDERFIVAGEAGRYPRDPSFSVGNSANCHCVSVTWLPGMEDPIGTGDQRDKLGKAIAPKVAGTPKTKPAKPKPKPKPTPKPTPKPKPKPKPAEPDFFEERGIDAPTIIDKVDPINDRMHRRLARDQQWKLWSAEQREKMLEARYGKWRVHDPDFDFDRTGKRQMDILWDHDTVDPAAYRKFAEDYVKALEATFPDADDLVRQLQDLDYDQSWTIDRHAGLGDVWSLDGKTNLDWELRFRRTPATSRFITVGMREEIMRAAEMESFMDSIAKLPANENGAITRLVRLMPSQKDVLPGAGVNKATGLSASRVAADFTGNTGTMRIFAKQWRGQNPAYLASDPDGFFYTLLRHENGHGIDAQLNLAGIEVRKDWKVAAAADADYSRKLRHYRDAIDDLTAERIDQETFEQIAGSYFDAGGEDRLIGTIRGWADESWKLQQRTGTAGGITPYGSTDIGEDFAEFVALAWSEGRGLRGQGSFQANQIRGLYPHRAKLMDEWLENFGLELPS